MALVRDGGLIGQLSGRVGPNVFSHNSGGSYIRAGTIPITSTTTYAMAAKARLGASSTAWKSLTASQRLSWANWAQQNPIVNRIGQTIRLSGLAAYNKLNARLAALSVAAIDDPPIIPAPEALYTYAQEYDIGTADFELNYTPDPLGTNQRLWVEAAITDSAAINFVENRKRFCGSSSAAQASPFDAQTIIEARLGTLLVGQRVNIFYGVVDDTTGLLSNLVRVDGVIVSTP